MLKSCRFPLALAALIGLTACVQQEAEITATAGEISSETPAFTQFPDIPTPVGSKILVERTLVLGGGDTWTGQMTMRVPYGPFIMFDFFKQKLPEFGWSEVTSVRAGTSVLTYIRETRIASIQIQAKTMQGSEVMVTVSPRDRKMGLGPRAGGMQPAPQRVPEAQNPPPMRR